MKVQMLLRLPHELKDKLQAEATSLGVTLTGLILQILWRHVKLASQDDM